jgi:hypothetical protein
VVGAASKPLMNDGHKVAKEPMPSDRGPAPDLVAVDTVDECAERFPSARGLFPLSAPTVQRYLTEQPYGRVTASGTVLPAATALSASRT